ncbi:uncharacterized protein LOC130724139 [Lotus japonicus]|uniref:uncharacterized protein LOC130724139 n=1 Tax=Lotus japonicus TaxID=34305 RepID=UPI00258A6A66|nr:uncharacterized protein LOC130724139 [Lotus japonicus]
MAATVKQMAAIVSMLGVVSFILGIVAGRKNLVGRTPILLYDGIVTCMCPPVSVVFAYLSVAFLIAFTKFGYISVFYPYKGKSVPHSEMFKHSTFTTFFHIAFFSSGVASYVLLRSTLITGGELAHLTINIHNGPIYECPTAKIDILEVGAVLSLLSSMLWLVALMLAGNAREEFFGKATLKPYDNAVVVNCCNGKLFLLGLA